MEFATNLLEAAKQAIAEGRIEKAIAIYQSAIRASESPDRNQRMMELGLLLWECYEIPHAEEIFREIADSCKSSLQHLQLIAKRYFGVGKFQLAATVMEIAVEANPPNADLLAQYSSCLERSNQVDSAIQAAEKAIQLQPENREALRMMARIERRRGDCSAAIARLKQHLCDFPVGETWKLKYELAACLDREGHYDQAWQELVEAKRQLTSDSHKDLALSYAIRKRQGELTKLITDADLRRWQQTTVEPRISIALLGGFPRSGTTLLESILTANREHVVGTDETGILVSQFIQSIVWKASDPYEAMLEIRTLEADQLQAGREVYLKFTSAIIDQAINDRMIIEKDPLITCDLALPLRLFPEARILMPLRDPRDVIVSYFFTMVPYGWSSSPATDIVESARFYHDVMRHWIHLRSRLPWDWLETRYEDMVANPPLQARRITEFLQIPFNESMIDPSNRTSQKFITTPTYDDITKPIHSQSVGKWKRYQKYLEPALPILESWAEEFGYA